MLQFNLYFGTDLIWDPTAHRRTPLLSFAAARWLFTANFGGSLFTLAGFAPEDRKIRVPPRAPSERQQEADL